MLQFYIFTVVVSFIDQLFVTILFLIRDMEYRIKGETNPFPLLYGDVLMRGVMNLVPALNACVVGLDLGVFLYKAIKRFNEPVVND